MDEDRDRASALRDKARANAEAALGRPMRPFSKWD
jgi:hypothetical protein